MKMIKIPFVFSFVTAATAGTVTVTPTGRYMAVPVENGAPKVFMEVFDGGKRVTYNYVEWAHGTTNWTGSLDLRGLEGRTLEFRFSGETLPDLSAADLKFADARFPAPNGQFDEPLRPQLHFTPPLGWANDPNGLSYRDGEWHLFYQHNPFGIKWDNMHWGHAVSKDLVHWQDVGYVLAPDETGTMYSGSAVVDHANTAGFGAGAHVLIYTAAGDHNKTDPHPRTQRIAWSLDGRNYVKWPDAAVEGRSDANRDPKVVWYAPGKHWVMAVYGDVEKRRHGVSLFTSKNLKYWTFASHVPGDLFDEGRYLYECPDFFEMPVEGEKGSRWVLTAANRQYAIGSFDGRTFKPEAERLSCINQIGPLRAIYAWQTFSDAPDRRRIQMAYFAYETTSGNPGYIKERAGSMPYMFNRGMTLPAELKLVRTADGLRLARFPAKELQTLRDGDATCLADFDGELAEVEFSCVPTADDTLVTLDLRGVKMEYSALRHTLAVNGQSTAWNLDAKGCLGLRIFVDRLGMEIFSLDGLQYTPLCDVAPDPANRKLSWSVGDTKRKEKPVRDVTERAWRLTSAVK